MGNTEIECMKLKQIEIWKVEEGGPQESRNSRHIL